MTNKTEMPHNLDAERALLGGLLIDPAAYDRVAAEVGEGDFYLGAHRTLYSAIGALAAMAGNFTIQIVKRDEKGGE